MIQVITTAGTFWVYSLLCLAGVIFVICFVPETKGRDLDSIAVLFLKKSHVEIVNTTTDGTKKESLK